jgi:hypothetical protein
VASLVVTIDTEPDLPKRRQASPGTLTNIPALVTLQERMPDVKLTLLTTYSVVNDGASLLVLERLARSYGSEIGAHLHPEETPPFVRGNPDETSLIRLPFEARAQKLATLTEDISAHFPAPVSYRAGRWMLSPEDLALLSERGFTSDSTVTPYVSWRLEHGPDFTTSSMGPQFVQLTGLWEVPVTISLNRGERFARHPLLQRYLQLCSLELLGLPSPLKAAWDLFRPIRPIWLRPTYSSAREMNRLADRLLDRAPDSVLNMMLHSNELAPGGRPFIRSQTDADRIMDRVVETCRYLTEQRGVESLTLSDYVERRRTLAAEAQESADTPSASPDRGVEPLGPEPLPL